MTATIIREDMIGKRIGRLLLLGFCKDKNGLRAAECVCDCGVTKTIPTGHLGTRVFSCGCLLRDVLKTIHITHGATSGGEETDEYKIWTKMKARCLNPRVKEWSRYGGRGIGLHPEWQESFAAFLAYVGRRPSAYHSIDRINNNGNYEPGNVRWATSKEQGRNKSNNHNEWYLGRLMCLAEISELTGIRRATIATRLAKGRSLEVALTTGRLRPLPYKRKPKLAAVIAP